MVEWLTLGKLGLGTSGWQEPEDDDHQEGCQGHEGDGYVAVGGLKALAARDRVTHSRAYLKRNYLELEQIMIKRDP